MGFLDDGMSWFPDVVFGWDLSLFGRIHDWLYCSRAHGEPGDWEEIWPRRMCDITLGRLVQRSAPTGFGWVARLVYAGVRRGGAGAYDTCGPQPEGADTEQLTLGLCRHNLPMPSWMRYGRTVGGVFYDRSWDAPAGSHPQSGPTAPLAQKYAEAFDENLRDYIAKQQALRYIEYCNGTPLAELPWPTVDTVHLGEGPCPTLDECLGPDDVITDDGRVYTKGEPIHAGEVQLTGEDAIDSEYAREVFGIREETAKLKAAGHPLFRDKTDEYDDRVGEGVRDPSPMQKTVLDLVEANQDLKLPDDAGVRDGLRVSSLGELLTRLDYPTVGEAIRELLDKPPRSLCDDLEFIHGVLNDEDGDDDDA